jgi:two-component system sensor kinase FixL
LAMSYELVDQAIQVPVLNREIAINQKRWQDLLENVQLAVIAVDNDGIITYANPYLQKLTGYSEPELIQKYAAMLLPATEQATLRDRLQQALLEGPRPHSRWRILCASGQERHLDWSSVRQFDSEGRVAGLVSIGADITDQLQAQHELQQSRQEMERMVRANLLGELASTMAHELNQPLAAILSNSQAALRFMDDDQVNLNELREILQDIVRDDKRAGEVIHSVRAMLRKGEVKHERFDIKDALNEVVTILHNEFDTQSIQVSMDLPEDLPLVEAGRVEIQQVLMNLLLNSQRAMTSTPSKQRIISVTANCADKIITLSVRDRGSGIDPDDLPNIFTAFYSTKYAGMGMGLAICKRIIEARGGKIWAENNSQGGAVFTFTLPVERSHG